MPDWRRLAWGIGLVTAGAATGYVAERALFRGRQEALNERPALEMPVGTVSEVRGPDGVRLNVETFGARDAPAPDVLLVHGFSMGIAFWYEQVVELRDRHRLIAYDHPGHGHSSTPASGRYSIDLLGDALAAVVEQATDPDRGPIVLAGHSMGGMAALAFARRHPDLFAERVGALLLASTTAVWGIEEVAVGFGIGALVRFQGAVERGAALLSERAAYLARTYRASSDLTYGLAREIAFAPGADPRHVELAEQLAMDADLATILRLSPVLLGIDEQRTVTDLDVPTVIVVGERDRMTPVEHARHMAAINPDVDLVELPGAAHMTPMEAADVVNGILEDLIAQVRRANRAA